MTCLFWISKMTSLLTKTSARIDPAACWCYSKLDVHAKQVTFQMFWVQPKLCLIFDKTQPQNDWNMKHLAQLAAIIFGRFGAKHFRQDLRVLCSIWHLLQAVKMGAKNSLPIEAVDGFSPEEVFIPTGPNITFTKNLSSPPTIILWGIILDYILFFYRKLAQIYEPIKAMIRLKVSRLEKRFRKLDSDGNNALR